MSEGFNHDFGVGEPVVGDQFHLGIRLAGHDFGLGIDVAEDAGAGIEDFEEGIVDAGDGVAREAVAALARNILTRS